MDREKGSTVIGTIALIAVAILVGIWIGAKKDMISAEIDEDIATIQTAVMKRVHKADTQETVTTEEQQVQEEAEATETPEA